MALGYLGKSLLWAGSPLMENGPQTGASQTGMTYKYNADFCTRAGKAFGELLTLVESGQTQYALAQFEYKNIYDHEKDPSATTCYSDIWWSFRNQGKVPINLPRRQPGMGQPRQPIHPLQLLAHILPQHHQRRMRPHSPPSHGQLRGKLRHGQRTAT